jgi:hypothetical protein
MVNSRLGNYPLVFEDFERGVSDGLPVMPPIRSLSDKVSR